MMKAVTPPRVQRSRNISGTKKNNLRTTKKPMNKSAEQKKRKRRISIEVKTNFKISPEHLSLLIQQQRLADLKQIRSSVALSHYYDSLMSLFMIIYSSSQIITSNIFDCKKQTTCLTGLKFIGMLFQLYEEHWNAKQLIKLRVMARNVMKMGLTPKIFQQRIEFICRKITLNHNMQKRIELAFLNKKLQSYWTLVINHFKFKEEVEMLDDMYELAPEKMAYWDFQRFVNEYLCNDEFYETIRDSIRRHKEVSNYEDQPIHHFTYEFILIEIFCFFEEQEDRLEINRNQCALI